MRDPEQIAPEIRFERVIEYGPSTTLKAGEISVRTRYLDNFNKEIANENGLYKTTENSRWTVLNYEQNKLQESESCKVQEVITDSSKSTLVFVRTDRSSTRNGEEKVKEAVLTPDLLLFYLRDHLDKLKKSSDRLQIRLVVPCRQETFGFTFQLLSKNEDEVRVKLTASSIFLAALAPRFEFVLQARHPFGLLRYSGRVMPLRLTKKAIKDKTQEYEEYDGILEILSIQ